MALPPLNKAIQDLEDKKLKKSTKAYLSNDEVQESSLTKSLTDNLSGTSRRTDRLAFETDPTKAYWSSVFIPIERTVPNFIKKRISIQDSLIGGIVLLRTNQIAAFARPRPKSSEMGYTIEMTPKTAAEFEDIEDDDKREAAKKDFARRIELAVEKIQNCGDLDPLDPRTFKTFIKMAVRDAIIIGSVAVEKIYDYTSSGKIFKRFRNIDAGTIYKARPQTGNTQEAAGIRRQSKTLLEKVTGRPINVDLFHNDVYSWIQVIDEQPRQAFTAQECVVHNFYPASDIGLNGYPLSPIDTAVTDITTHLNIATMNRLYFEFGRASKGFIVVTSEDVDQKDINQMRNTWNTQINSVANSHRTPVFGVKTTDKVEWVSIDQSAKDMEYQYLADANIRAICTAFQVSPEELPGYAYLSKGTAAQSLSESNQEFRLTSARDQGLRPLLGDLEDLFNRQILPDLDPVLARKAVFKLVGLDAETPEKKSIGTQRDQQVFMDYDLVLEKHELPPMGKLLGGKFPFNPNYQAVLDRYFTVGFILENILGIKGAASDPRWDYVRDPFWFQKVQMDMAAQQAEQAAQQAPPGDGGGAPPSDGPSEGGNAQNMPKDDSKNSPQAADPGSNTTDQGATNAISQASQALNKSDRAVLDAFLGKDMLRHFADLGYPAKPLSKSKKKKE